MTDPKLSSPSNYSVVPGQIIINFSLPERERNVIHMLDFFFLKKIGHITSIKQTWETPDLCINDFSNNRSQLSSFTVFLAIIRLILMNFRFSNKEKKCTLRYIQYFFHKKCCLLSLS